MILMVEKPLLGLTRLFYAKMALGISLTPYIYTSIYRNKFMKFNTTPSFRLKSEWVKKSTILKVQHVDTLHIQTSPNSLRNDYYYCCKTIKEV